MFRRKSFYVSVLLGMVVLLAVVFSYNAKEPKPSGNMSVSKEMNDDKAKKDKESNSNQSKEVEVKPEPKKVIMPIINLNNEVNADQMYHTLTYLTEQPRAAGTDGEKRAVEYIEKKFKSLGYETEIQEFPVEDFKEIHRKVLINDKPLEGDIRAVLGRYVSGSVTAELVNAGKARDGDFGDEVNGKIALVERGAIPDFVKIDNLLKKGAVGAIMYNDLPAGSFKSQVIERNDIPAVTITREQGLKLLKQLEEGVVKASVDVEVETVKNPSYNVIAIKKPDKNQDTGQIVTVGAHHDSVPEGPGANDDASGVSAVLELARIFSNKPIDTELRFITFGAEERGLVGSTHYVYNLPADERSKIVAHFQMDMVGAAAAGGQKPGGGLIMFTINGQKNLVTGLGAAASKNVFPEAIPYGELGRSDHQPFHDVGIPAALFIHAPLEPDYHQPSDTLDKISKEKLQQVAEIVGSAVYTITSPDTPAIEKNITVPASVEYQYEDREL